MTNLRARRWQEDEQGRSTDLDPGDWPALREQSHRMLDDMFDHLQTIRDKPLWQPAPSSARALFNASLPRELTDLAAAYAIFRDNVLPYGSGNIHPGFMGWAQGGGTVTGMLADMLAAGLNANLGGRDHMPIEVERQITRWVRELFSFPTTAGGLFLTGASQANFVAVLLAKTKALGTAARARGIPQETRLVAYASTEVHGCVPRAVEMAGVGTDFLRRIPVDSRGRMDLRLLQNQIVQDKADGYRPFMVVGTAGTVDTGAIDDLRALRHVASTHDIHFHVDGALGALGILSDELSALLVGIDTCDSLAFDFHKWGQVPYDAGFLLVRDETLQYRTFASEAAYLTRAASGLAGGDWWPCDHGPDLSRSFRALKTWFTLKTYGLKALGDSIAANCALARRLGQRIEREPALRLLAPVALNIVCFAYAGHDRGASDAVNMRIVERLHADGRVAPSVTYLNGRPTIRVAIVNHRTDETDIDARLNGVLIFGLQEELAAC
jgi:glutamate/tyrosine decarboxylase-like PLP-dependent enzyme